MNTHTELQWDYLVTKATLLIADYPQLEVHQIPHPQYANRIVLGIFSTGEISLEERLQAWITDDGLLCYVAINQYGIKTLMEVSAGGLSTIIPHLHQLLERIQRSIL